MLHIWPSSKTQNTCISSFAQDVTAGGAASKPPSDSSADHPPSADHQRCMRLRSGPIQKRSSRSLPQATAAKPSIDGNCAGSTLDRLAAVDNSTRHPFSARLRYAFDNYMAKGTIALIFGLFVLSLLIILVVSIVLVVSGTLLGSDQTRGIDFPEMLWR